MLKVCSKGNIADRNIDTAAWKKLSLIGWRVACLWGFGIYIL